MHGINRSLSFGWASPGMVEFSTLGFARETSGATSRIRNLLRPPNAGERFSADGRVEAALAGNPAGLRILMRKLSARIAREGWKTAIGDGLAAADNPHIPAGYTYLLQLIAHDMVHSSVSLSGSATAVGLANTRLAPLTLETIYGGGPDVCPQAYEIDREHRDHIAVIPRTRFRVGQSRNMDGTMSGCPFRDIARAVPANVRDRGLDPAEQLDPLDPCNKPLRTEALLADPRNDDHAIISQFAGLWQALHNHILDLIAANLPVATIPPAERAYRRFFCGRFVTTLIYRNIIIEDVLRLILHPEVHKLYSGANPPNLDDDFPGPKDGMPVEFLAGAFRFGHAMVRNDYLVNSDVPQPTKFALKQSSLRNPEDLPLNANWLLDWSRFFDLSERLPNYSHRIGPAYAGALKDTWLFPRLTDLGQEGLPDRDLVTAGYSGLWSVSALSAEIRARGLAAAVPDFGDWRAPLRAWLSEPPPGNYDPDPFTPQEINILTNDPPLPLFVLLEAGHAIGGAGAPTDKAAGESLHLGAFGSIIVAETIYGALARTPIAFETAGPKLADRIAAASREFLGDASALDAIPEIATMADLLHFMINGGAVQASNPGP